MLERVWGNQNVLKGNDNGSLVIKLIALTSRVGILSLAAISNSIVGPYDSSVSLQTVRGFEESSTLRHCQFESYLLSPLTFNWDGEYFSRISSVGYEYENFHAFYPLLPVLTRGLTALCSGLLQIKGESLCFLVAYCPIFLNNFLFVLAVEKFYRLSLECLQDKKLALQSALFFCFTPASIFMSANYTEPLFAYLSFAGMLEVERVNAKDAAEFNLSSVRCIATASVFFCLAALTRSNGAMLGVVYLGYSTLTFVKNVYEETGRVDFFSKTVLKRVIMVASLMSLFVCLASLIPVFLVQAFGYSQFCLGGNKSCHSSPWCEDRIPFIYQYIQKKYWNNGFLRYYEVKQLPNFFLALPMGILSFRCIKKFFNNSPSGNHLPGNFSYSFRILPYVLHLLVLVCVCTFFMHVQVLTRFVSACPPLYWYAAICHTRFPHGEGKVIVGYFLAYATIGSAMFTCYYPWT